MSVTLSLTRWHSGPFLEHVLIGFNLHWYGMDETTETTV